MDISNYVSGVTSNILNSIEPNSISNTEVGSAFIDLATLTRDSLDNLVISSGQSITSSVNGLRILNSTNTYVIYQTSDYGGGQWYVDTNDTTTADNTGTVIVTADGKRIKRVFQEALNPVWFGAKGDGVTDDTQAFLKCFAALSSTNTVVEIPSAKVKYLVNQPITIDSTITGQVGFSIRGKGSAGATLIEYSGAGYLFNYLGTGTEGGVPLTRFDVRNIRVNGGTGNTTSLGGFNLKRIYIVNFENVFSTGWKRSDSTPAISVSIRNCFNVYWNGGQIANGFPAPAGSHNLIIGSESPNAWNTSNVEFKNLLIQYAGGNGIHITQDANIFDNFTVNNVSLGKNGGWSIYGITSPGTSPLVNNITITNNHFESPGYNTTSTPNAGTGHIFLNKATGVKIHNNSFQDALTYISLDSVNNFEIGNGNKFFETGFYNLSGNTLLKLATTTANCIGTFGENTVRTDQIDNQFTISETGGFRVDLARRFRTKAIESTWNGELVANPANYQGTLIDRYQSANAPFDQMITNGANWYRLMVSSKYKGERTAIPTTTENTGSWYANIAPTVQGQTGSAYMLFGWINAGGSAWKEMRMPLDYAPFVINSTTTDLSQSQLNTLYPDSNTNNNIGKEIYCPNIVAGGKIYTKMTSTSWVSSTLTTVV